MLLNLLGTFEVGQYTFIFVHRSASDVEPTPLSVMNKAKRRHRYMVGPLLRLFRQLRLDVDCLVPIRIHRVARIYGTDIYNRDKSRDVG